MPTRFAIPAGEALGWLALVVPSGCRACVVPDCLVVEPDQDKSRGSLLSPGIGPHLAFYRCWEIWLWAILEQ